jgi:FAD/FMN-containing dehydrogenase
LRLRDKGTADAAAVPRQTDFAAASDQAASRPWPLYPLEPDRTYVNVGFWSAVPTLPGQPEGATNRVIERKVSELDGHKSLYSDSYYDTDEFAQLYGGDIYDELKKRYDPDHRLLDLYSKAVQRK